MECEWCNKEFLKTRTNRNNTRFCSRKCYLEYHSKEKYKKYLEDNSIAYGIKNMQKYKKHFLQEQDFKCAICGMSNTWNNKPLVFILDHIDGNADNNFRSNLRLICPTCDSQLDTYKSKNKNSARAKYRHSNTVKATEPISGNINSGHDDNVESLTDNADGNDVGIALELAARE